MGLFKKKNSGNSGDGGQGSGGLSAVFEKEVMENAYSYALSIVKAAGRRELEDYIEDAREHYLNDCMDLDDVGITLECLENYNEAMMEKVKSGKHNDGDVLASVYALSMIEKMKEKGESMR